MIKRILFFILAVMLMATTAFASTITSPATEVQAGYWTLERLQGAKPLIMKVDGTPPDNVPLTEPIEPAYFGASSKTGEQSILLTEDEAIETAAIIMAVEPLQGFPYPPPHNTFPLPNAWYGMFPHRTVGKLFFTQLGTNYVCSASVVGNKCVVTAGHCLHKGNNSSLGWSTNLSFRPAYNGNLVNPNPYGIWTPSTLTVFSRWFVSGNPGGLCRDLGYMRMNPNTAGQTIGSVVGHLGYATTVSRLQQYNNFGYPAAVPWDGKRMIQTQAAYSSTNNPGCAPDIPSGTPPSATGIGTTQTAGCSGGPWLITYRPGATGFNNYINSVNSFIYTPQPLRIFGPYFDSVVLNNIILPCRAP